MTVSTLTEYKDTPAALMRLQVQTCQKIVDEAVSQGHQDLIPLFLAVAWQESRLKEGAKGKWLCTNKGTLKIRKGKKPRCIPKEGRKSSTLTRARGPMQILPVYHCPGGENTKCDYIKHSISLLASLTGKYGSRKGIAIYAGGLFEIEKNVVAQRYARMSLKREKRLQRIKNRVDSIVKLFNGLIPAVSL